VTDLSRFLAANRRPYRVAPAPPVDAPAAGVRVVDDDVEDGARRLRLEVRSSVGPERLDVFAATGDPVRLLAVNGTPVSSPPDTGTGNGWLLQHFGDPPDGILTLDIRAVDPTAPVELVVVEVMMRLPPIAGIDTQRPPGWTPHAGRLTDVSLFRQVITIE
jgi:hypothetical protein